MVYNIVYYAHVINHMSALKISKVSACGNENRQAFCKTGHTWIAEIHMTIRLQQRAGEIFSLDMVRLEKSNQVIEESSDLKMQCILSLGYFDPFS